MEKQVAEVDKNQRLLPPPIAPMATETKGEQATEPIKVEPPAIPHAGKLIVDATTCPQDISYPTDLNLLNDSREKAEELIDFLFNPKK